jgi:hypothetical protein
MATALETTKEQILSPKSEFAELTMSEPNPDIGPSLVRLTINNARLVFYVLLY